MNVRSGGAAGLYTQMGSHPNVKRGSYTHITIQKREYPKQTLKTSTLHSGLLQENGEYRIYRKFETLQA